MNNIFSILSYSVGSLFWGILIALVCTGLLVLIINSLRKDSNLTPISWLISTVIFLLLTFQSTLMVGTSKIISVTQHYSEEAVELIEGYVGDKFSDISNKFEELKNDIHSDMRDYIWRRVFWSLGVIAVGAIAIDKTMETSRRGNHATQRGNNDRIASRRTERYHSRRSRR